MDHCSTDGRLSAGGARPAGLLASAAGARRGARPALFEVTREPGLDLLGVIAERAGLPLVCDRSGLVHDVEALRPAGIDLVGGVPHRVHRERDAVAEAPDEMVGD